MGCGSSAPVELTGSETHDELRDLVRRGAVDAAVGCVSNEECDLSLGRKAWGKEPLGVKGANALGEAIGRPTCKAKKLVLAGTKLGGGKQGPAAGMGMKKFAAGLAANTSIEVLDLSGNPLCEAEDYRSYTVYQLRKLKVLDGVGIEQTEQLHAKERFAGRLTVEGLVERLGHRDVVDRPTHVPRRQGGRHAPRVLAQRPERHGRIRNQRAGDGAHRPAGKGHYNNPEVLKRPHD